MKNKMPMKVLAYSSMALALAACVSGQSNKTAQYMGPSVGGRNPADAGIVKAALPPVSATLEQQEKIWKQYCIGNRNSTDVPVPNYKNPEVVYATKKLALVESQSFYFYSGPLYAYGLKNGKTLVEPHASFPADIPQTDEGRKNAHAFLTLLCGEFRDRPTLIKEKVKWVTKMNKLPVKPQQAINLKKDHLWQNMSAESYQVYINNSVMIYNMKKRMQTSMESTDSDYNTIGPVKLGKYNEESPVEPYTICETKYIFHKYVIPKKNFNSDTTYAQYRNDYKKFRDKGNYCTPADKDYLYDFRGDSNFKPNSPESNGMIWYSSTIANSCMRTKDGQLVLKDSVKDKFADNPNICQDYFSAPFAHRWSAARAGLATWLFHSRELDSLFAASDDNVTVFPSYSNLGGAFDHSGYGDEPKFLAQYLDNQTEYWKRSDLGFNAITGLGTLHPDKGLVFERLRNSVNRHTDWYASGYDDKISGPDKVKTQAYSPFVASSFEMQASDGFTAPGVTVSSPADGCKHWMFVFKIKRDQWYSSRSIAEGKKVDFNRNWFDETSLGTNHLADHERALDRLGTALEGELDSIMYLNNLSQYGGVQEKCGSGFKTNKQGVPEPSLMNADGSFGLIQ